MVPCARGSGSSAMRRARANALQVVSFFFQAEDGIRDTSVTGVQTCALPISSAVLPLLSVGAAEAVGEGDEVRAFGEVSVAPTVSVTRSDGRRAERAPVVAAHEGDRKSVV